MPLKMWAALNQFFTPRHKHKGAKLSQKLWKYAGTIFFSFYDSGPFDGCPVQESPMPSS